MSVARWRLIQKPPMMKGPNDAYGFTDVIT